MVASDGRCRRLGVHTLPPNQEPTERWGFKLSKLTPTPLAILHLPVSPPNRATNWGTSVKGPSQAGPPFLIQPIKEEVHRDLDSSEGKIISNPPCRVDNGATQGNRTPERKKMGSGGA